MAPPTPDEPPSRPPAPTRPGRYPVLSNRAIGWAALILIVAGIGLAVWLLIAFGNGQHPQQLDAIKTAGTFVVGTGGAAALWLTARRQQTSEIALNQKDTDQTAAERAFTFQQQQAADQRTHLNRVAAATEADAQARRITDLYTKAADQLGSDKAPVRLAGLYALERLAQDNPDQRHTIVNLLCAYLRMPYQLAGNPSAHDADDETIARHQTRTQEREVRLTAQRILTTHLRPGPDPDHPVTTFWANADLDLTGAILIETDFRYCRTATAQFNKATFTGTASFIGATFTSDASFDNAKFTIDALFTEVTFASGASFVGALFTSDVSFRKAAFTNIAWFIGTAFASRASFDKATFSKLAQFTTARFASGASFNETTFAHGATFDSAAEMTGEPWVRLDVHEYVVQGRQWPKGWVVASGTDRPPTESQGRWGRLKHQQPTA